MKRGTSHPSRRRCLARQPSRPSNSPAAARRATSPEVTARQAVETGNPVTKIGPEPQAAIRTDPGRAADPSVTSSWSMVNTPALQAGWLDPGGPRARQPRPGSPSRRGRGSHPRPWFQLPNSPRQHVPANPTDHGRRGLCRATAPRAAPSISAIPVPRSWAAFTNP